MQDKILKHYLQIGTYTYAGAYGDYFRSLPDNVAELGRLVCSQVIHRVTLHEGNTNANAKLQYGDMTKFPWYRMRCEDDILMTAAAMTAELFRLDGRGFVPDRETENKIVVTCRYVSVLMSAILKAKNIPCRSRAGFAPYFQPEKSMDHWINQYWKAEESRWVTIDADGLGTCSLKAIIRALFYDFHALMNDEISYKFQPCYIDNKFERLTEQDLKELDELAELLLEPDENFEELESIWETKKKYRIMNSPLVGDYDNVGRW